MSEPGSEPGAARFDETWLALREAADAAARSAELARRAAGLLDGAARPGSVPVGGVRVVHDLGCGTGSMSRWLAPRLPGPQHWVLRDSDPDLLARAAALMPAQAADGAPVTAETRCGDVTGLTAADLEGASLVTASALLDLLTLGEVQRLASACVVAGAPALFALSVRGRVEFDPADPLDARIEAAFNAHQRREVGGRALLGPDAPDAAAGAFTSLGADVELRETPWLLGRAGDGGLLAGWLRGWVAAAAEQEPGLPVEGYLARRLAEARAGALAVTVHHADVLAIPFVS